MVKTFLQTFEEPLKGLHKLLGSAHHRLRNADLVCKTIVYLHVGFIPFPNSHLPLDIRM